MSGSYENGPYIPPQHEKYDLLPYSREHGGEVFDYPWYLMDIDERICDHIDGPRSGPEEARASKITPYGEKSYLSYYSMLEGYARRFASEDPELSADILRLIDDTKAMNRKEFWSVARYLGKPDDDGHYVPFTPGRCYYWPCNPDNPEYSGVIDDEEFTSYMYPCDPEIWEILEDPTGMAARSISGEADTVSFWSTDRAVADGEISIVIDEG